MKIICPKCEIEMYAETGRYHYIESGLNNVYVDNITIYKCPCGESVASLFQVGNLNNLIAKTVLRKPSLLNGNEIKFLRKNLHMPAKSFAQKLGVAITTYSKWENDKQNHDKKNDRLVRAIYILLKGLKQTEAESLLNHISMEYGNDPFNSLIVAKKIEGTYVITHEQVYSESLYPCSKIETQNHAYAAPIINISKQSISSKIASGMISFFSQPMCLAESS